MKRRELTIRLNQQKGEWIERETQRLGCSINALINMIITETMEKEKRDLKCK